MNTQQKLNHSSPVVQRVLRLRERMNRRDVATETALTPSEKHSTSAAMTQAKTNYQWQMWQKSDFSAYAAAEHQCKGVYQSLSIEREEDYNEV